MTCRTAHVVDNRDAQEMYSYLEARVETMKRRIQELERENEALRRTIECESAPALKKSA
jgi:predicted RNase H-like nuclease (RuvC/YqgF family)